MYNGGFDCTGNVDLNCIEVDNEDHAFTNWFNIPFGATYSVDCNNACSQDGLSNITANEAKQVNKATSQTVLKHVSLMPPFAMCVCRPSFWC